VLACGSNKKSEDSRPDGKLKIEELTGVDLFSLKSCRDSDVRRSCDTRRKVINLRYLALIRRRVDIDTGVGSGVTGRTTAIDEEFAIATEFVSILSALPSVVLTIPSSFSVKWKLLTDVVDLGISAQSNSGSLEDASLSSTSII
jgi:hypothetical protein